MQGAHENAAEINPFWIGAVLAGNLAGMDNRTLNIATFAFVALRLTYNYVYINQKSRQDSFIRTFVWLAGMAIPMTLFVLAGNKLRVGYL